ncbi:hypothetical protein QU481_02155 [Crenobacter sp. SG2303]|uniref:DUF4178 domain-containing protein n=1 Tax=Crenobacter oryzisoli TaxID=3056844 RepID=A0ABT7XIT2_9NEIS|nr:MULTISPECIES: hypothetical protein [unclassified Crenobacter]MDN0073696.1 hypothetical protein [Crenobacter sp. SG2303]MDN0084064.1 hypothetical protein [Crenobacter sp. SG2305]
METLSPSPSTSAANLKLPPPESDKSLAARAMPVSETVLMLQDGAGPLYGLVRKSHVRTEQNEYLCVQFRGVARLVDSSNWQPLDNVSHNYATNEHCAWIKANFPSQSVSFGPSTGIVIEPLFEQSELANYLLVQLINWAKAHYPDYSVAPGAFALSDNLTEQEKLARQAFFAAQGFDFEWLDPEQRTGRYSKDKVHRLIGMADENAASEISGAALLESISRQEAHRHELEGQLANLDSGRASLQRQLQRERSINQILSGILLTVLVATLFWAIW